MQGYAIPAFFVSFASSLCKLKDKVIFKNPQIKES